MSAGSDNTDSDAISVYIVIAGVDPDMLTGLLNVKPTSCWRKGDRHPRIETLTRGEDVWLVHSPVFRQGSFAEQLDSLIELLKPGASQLGRLTHGEVTLECCFWTDTKPIVRLTSKQVGFLADIKAAADFDINYSECQVEEGLRQDSVAVRLGVMGIEPQTTGKILGLSGETSDSALESARGAEGESAPEAVWEITLTARSEPDESAEGFSLLTEQVDALSKLLRPHVPRFRELPAHHTYFRGVICAHERPSIELTSNQMQFLASANALVELDVNYPGDEGT